MCYNRIAWRGILLSLFLSCAYAQQPPASTDAAIESRLKDALSAAEQTSGANGALTASALANLGEFYLRTGKRDDASPLLQRAVGILDRNSNVAPLEQARILRALGGFYLGLRSPSDAEKYLIRAVDILQHEVGAEDRRTIQAEFELGSAYVMWGANTAKAAPLIELATTDSHLQGLPPEEVRARLSNLALLRFWQRSYPAVQTTVDRIFASAGGAAIPAEESESIWELSADAWIRTGDFAKAEALYRKILDSERRRSADPGSNTLYALAGLAMDQGRYKDADALYREALQDGLRSKDLNPVLFDIGRDWANLRRDLGREMEADALEKWTGDNLSSPTPPPPVSNIDVPSLVQVAGLTPNQMIHRLSLQYGDDLTVLWNQLGLSAGAFSKCYFCDARLPVTMADGTNAVIVRMKNNDPPVRRLMFIPTGRVSGGVQEWRVSGVLDLPFGDRRETQRFEKSNNHTWIVLDVIQSAGAVSEPSEEWYEITDGQFRKTTPYPAGSQSRDSYIDDLLQKLHAASEGERMTAVLKLSAIPDALKTPRVVKELVDLLERENAYIRERSKAGTGVGEGYGEYVSVLLDIVFKAANLQDSHTLEVLAGSSYNDDSRFAKELADAGGIRLIPIALELLKADEAFDRWDGVGLLARLYEKRDFHQMDVRTSQSLKQAIIDTTKDSDVSMRMTAVRYLGQIGSASDLALLQQISESDKEPVVRQYAIRAMDSIRKRTP